MTQPIRWADLGDVGRYCAVVTQDAWPDRLARAIAAQIRLHRTEQGLSAQQLADRCDEIGMPIPRNVVANLENGRRTGLTVAELFVLARALRVPPLELVFPIGRVPVVEVLPERHVDTWRAFRWATGEGPFLGEETRDGSTLSIAYQSEDLRALRSSELFREHAQHYRAWGRASGRGMNARLAMEKATDDAEVQRLRIQAEQEEAAAAVAKSELRAARQRIRDAGLTPPDLGLDDAPASVRLQLADIDDA